MAYQVLLTAGAERDIEDIHAWISEFDSPQSADKVLDRLLAAAEGLAQQPGRGTIPRELRELGITDFRQVYFKPYRLIYRVLGQKVVVHIIADGRRDMQAVLARRLLSD